MITVYNAKITDFTQADYAKMYSLLDCAIKQKIDAKKKKEDKMRSLAGYILLWRGAYELYNKTDFIITFNRYGKPFCDFCHFNISHSADRVICVISDNPVGVDIQKICDIKQRKKYRFFNSKESFYVNQMRELLSERYIEIFTKKEAAVKMLGLPLVNSSKIDVFSGQFNFECENYDGFMVTVCSPNI